MDGPPSFAAVVLAGGTGERLGGADKAALEYAGRPLLDRVLDALADAAEVVVAGPARPTSAPASFVREEPPGGGPVAGLLAGRRALGADPERLVVVAVDMPLLSRETVTRLLLASADRDGAVLVGGDGRRQLACVVRTDRLDAVSPTDGGHGRSWHGLLAGLDLAEVTARSGEDHDIDTWADLTRAAPGPVPDDGPVA
jgi:molybdopterin-guanine dinucleotide biosynthesis protein A